MLVMLGNLSNVKNVGICLLFKKIYKIYTKVFSKVIVISKQL